MQVLNSAAFLDCLSKPRVKSYINFFYPGVVQPNESDLVYMYQWNNEISEILWRLISIIEITMRNKIHKELSRLYFNAPKEIVSNGVYLNEFVNNKVPTATIGDADSCNWYHAINFNGEALVNITKRTHHKKPNNKYYKKPYTVTPDDVISGLTFGFWRLIFKNLGNAGVSYQSIISDVFVHSPFYKQKVTQSLDFKVDSRVAMIHSFRNRISHHEPVWKLKDMKEEKITPIPGNANNVNVLKFKPSNKKEVFEHLTDYYKMMLEYLLWLDKDVARSFKSSWWNDRFFYVCPDKGVNSFLCSYSSEYELTKTHFKRNINRIIKKGNVRIITDKSRKAIILPVK